jgi:hypothetical protein
MSATGKQSVDFHDYLLLDSIARVMELKSTVLYCETNTFEPIEGRPIDSYYTTEVSHSGVSSFRTDSLVTYGPGMTRHVTMLPIDTGNMYIRATLQVWPVEPFPENPASLVISFEREQKPYQYGSLDLGKVDSLEPGRWYRITARLKVPEEISSEDIVKVYIWHRGKGTLFCDDFQVELIKR